MTPTRRCRICGGEPRQDFVPLHLALFHRDKVAATFLGYRMGEPVWFDADDRGDVQVGIRPGRRGGVEWTTRPPAGAPMVQWDAIAREGMFRFGVLVGAPSKVMPPAPDGMSPASVRLEELSEDDEDDEEWDDEGGGEGDDDDQDDYWGDAG